jgi:hypothetical protein
MYHCIFSCGLKNIVFTQVRNEKNRILEENRMLSKEVDRAYLERDRLRYI